MSLVLYFAYGSNLNPTQMVARCPSARFFAPATLENHALVFRGPSLVWGGGVASIRWQKDRQVRGVLYAMKSSDLHALDAYEGSPRYYERVQRRVRDSHDVSWRVHTYVLPGIRAARALPSERYLSVIEEAYARHDFDVEELWRAMEESA